GAWIAERHGAPYWVAHRADLHAALKATAERHREIEIRTGFGVTRVEQDGHGVRVATADGATVEGPALIGADGLWSAVRGFLAPGVSPQFA
ncbi:3-hydroxybenzoate 6-monooxygenase, partial [Salmonella enterica]